MVIDRKGRQKMEAKKGNFTLLLLELHNKETFIKARFS